MKCAKFGARSIRVLVAGAAGALAVAIAPMTAQASTPSSGEECVMYGWAMYTQDFAKKNELTECTPGTSGLFPIFNINLMRPLINSLNTRFGGMNAGGPVAGYRERRVDGAANGAERLADAINGPQLGGPGMAAGYTPTETTNQWIQRHLQPLRDAKVNSWLNTSYSNPKDTHSSVRYSSDIVTITLGADMPVLNDNLIVGVFGSYTHSDVNTNFNKGDVDSSIGTLGPYLYYSVNDWLAVDFTVAGSFGKNDNLVGPSPNARGEQDTSGYFVSLNVNGNYWIGNYGFQGRMGVLHSYFDTDAYKLRGGGGSVGIPGTDNEITQLNWMAQFNYFYDKGLPRFESVMAMPYFRLTLNHDVSRDKIKVAPGATNHPNDRTEVVIAGGVSLFNNGPWSNSLEVGYTAGRDEFESFTVSHTLNYAF